MPQPPHFDLLRLRRDAWAAKGLLAMLAQILGNHHICILDTRRRAVREDTLPTRRHQRARGGQAVAGDDAAADTRRLIDRRNEVVTALGDQA